MAPPPTDAVAIANALNKDDRGLSLGSTVGIGVGVALIVIFGLLGAWIFVRRRRRVWAVKRKEQGDPEAKGETPDAEIAKKVEGYKKDDMRVDGAVEIDDGEEKTAELKGGDEKMGMKDTRPLSELQTESNTHQMASAQEPVEIGGGEKSFVAELEGSRIPGDVHKTDDRCPLSGSPNVQPNSEKL